MWLHPLQNLVLAHFGTVWWLPIRLFFFGPVIIGELHYLLFALNRAFAVMAPYLLAYDIVNLLW